MPKDAEPFEVPYKGGVMQVYKLVFPRQHAFQVEMAGRKTIVIARATDYYADRFWTSIPEGRQDEAERVGAVIEDYIKLKV